MASDARKGKIYTKYAKLIEIATREGGADPGANVRLRTLIESAKAESVPNANIDRAIKKGAGALRGEAMQEVIYEAYGPEGAAFIIEALTDNRNRTLGNVKTILSKNDGRFAESGSVLWMFERRGVIDTQIPDSVLPKLDALELMLIEVGAEDLLQDGNHLRIISSMTQWTTVRDKANEQKLIVLSAGLQYIAKQTLSVDDTTMTKISAIIDALEEDDDVSEVHTNTTTAQS